ncbi:hypothetical protein [Desulfosporosinus sp. Sb-LF]|uniref:hypothetical protein n=1 Tax=Desulfosporosinus sp. Sb-LF TaxID=2560027 RepID=UPI00107F6A6C|nr:hypothetical protein [Desulfosporosinus sp. Sb-LF]TGE31113.1 hypothetical protein E4K68_18925 [Desulfosporosinus sp. Sb-LF]
MLETNIEVETEEDTRARERDYIVKWMKGLTTEMESISEQKAFMAKLNAICTYHSITLEELMQQDS